MDNRKVQRASVKAVEQHNLYIFGEIDHESTNGWLYQIDHHFKENPGTELVLNINSHGGFCHSGFAMYNAIRMHCLAGNKIATRIIGRAGSMAGVIALAGDRREIAKYASVMIHATTVTINDQTYTAKFLSEEAKSLQFTGDLVKEIYLERSNVKEAYFNHIIESGCDVELRSYDAIALGICDTLVAV